MPAPRKTLANAIRALSMDAVQAANSGHPGAPMGMADIAEVLWNDHLRHSPQHPAWPNRDRFVLSNGHGSMLLYALLHLSGYGLPMAQIRQFRQLGSQTPGHPEYGDTPGVETTTGPLGQGLANAVGFALAEKTLAAQFNRPLEGASDNAPLIDHRTFVFAGDGCLMEGISHEACSLAGTLALGKLLVFYDDNRISIDGEVSGWFTDDTAARFAAYGWQVLPNVDGHDPTAINRAIQAALADPTRPSLLCCRTTIGYGAPNKQGTADCHGAPLGDQEIAAARAALGWPHPPFVIPAEIYAGWNATERGTQLEADWQARRKAYAAQYPVLAAELQRRLKGELPADFAQKAADYIARCQEKGEKIATRKASQNALNAYAPLLPELLGGSADLTGSNLTLWSASVPISTATPAGNYLYYGVREHAMTAIMNGLALHGGFIPYGGTFLVFMDYCRNATRLAALMRQRSIFVFTHDSIGLGEDGPTHQPVEQLATLRATPNMQTWRPCDATETAVAWRAALTYTGPSALVLSRQSLPPQPRNLQQLAAIERGGYVLVDAADPQLILLATGSEVEIAVQAAQTLTAQSIVVRVVSMPCAEVFAAQDAAYRESVLPNAIRARVAIEAAHPDYWHRHIGLDGRVLGLASFGASAPGPQLFDQFGFTAANLVALAHECLDGQTAAK